MRIILADRKDFDYLVERDRHARPDTIRQKIHRSEILIGHLECRRAGYLRYGYFWDEIPFMNVLWIEDELRGKGFGTQLVLGWEREMNRLGHNTVMTSTQSNERAQHLYRKLGYKDCGSLLLPDEPLEILFLKQLAGTSV